MRKSNRLVFIVLFLLANKNKSFTVSRLIEVLRMHKRKAIIRAIQRDMNSTAITPLISRTGDKCSGYKYTVKKANWKKVKTFLIKKAK